MFSVMPLPVFRDYSPAHHNPTAAPSPLSSSPIRASSPPRPLSPRDHDELCSGRSSRRQIQSSPIAPSRFKFASRPARPNPVLRGREGFQQTRRNLFLQKVQQRSDDQRWERRGVESKLLSAEWFELDQARRRAKILDRDGMITEADIADAERLLEEHEREARLQPGQHPDDGMDDDMLYDEEAEFEALIASNANQTQSSDPKRPTSPQWADDDDYDALFMDMISEQENQLPTSSADVEMS